MKSYPNITTINFYMCFLTYSFLLIPMDYIFIQKWNHSLYSNCILESHCSNMVFFVLQTIYFPHQQVFYLVS